MLMIVDGTIQYCKKYLQDKSARQTITEVVKWTFSRNIKYKKGKRRGGFLIILLSDVLVWITNHIIEELGLKTVAKDIT